MRSHICLVGALALAACSEPPTAPDVDDDPPEPTVTVVTVRSPLGDIIAVGRTAALEAAAEDAGGSAVSASLAWTSGDVSVATVDASGVVTGIGAGTTTITATADGVSGTLELTVADADLDGIRRLLDDSLADRLLGAVGGTTESVVRSAWARCADGQSTGSLTSIRDCVAEARVALSSHDDPAGGPLTGLLGLFLDWMDRHLHLNDTGA